ncbi:hypothetical protein QYM36_003909 [Artemia franciscana]|uniref:Uncharacterized protein n=1 Tax=Artemia franciscana TaxID=6661 RepID=A0AA88L7Y5_ARTSF|nr:hypothetical protein QYM36_003909 [Artemia franciscana]
MAEFIEVPLKRSSEVDLVRPFKALVQSRNGDSGKQENLDSAFAEFNNLRQFSTNRNVEKQQSYIDLMVKYHDQLLMLESKFQPQDITIPFKWKDAFDKGSIFGGKPSLTITSLLWERCCVLFNIGALQSQIACTQSVHTDDGLKTASKLFQQSSGIFEHLKELFTEALGQNIPTPDIQQDTLAALSALMLAQGQEAIALKGINDLWLEVADTNPISDLTLTFPYGNKAAVVSFKENNDAGDILTLYYEGDRVPMLDFEINQTPLVIAPCGYETVTVIVDLQDVNDNEPFFTSSPSRMNYPEATIDGDHGINQPIRYELREGNENIDLCPQTGNLTLVKQIDRDVYGAKSYVLEFEIFAIEDDFSSESITGDVLMTVTDVNDNIPTFSYSGPYTVWVPEGTAGTIIFNHFIEVTDRDFRLNHGNDIGMERGRRHCRSRVLVSFVSSCYSKEQILNIQWFNDTLDLVAFT